MKKKTFGFLIIGFLIAIIGVNIWSALSENREKDNVRYIENEDPIATKGQPAPDFELKTLEGDTFKLSDYRGKKVVLNFWASWCAPCKAEMPHMQNFYKANKDEGVEVIAVNRTLEDKGMDAIQGFVDDYGLTFPIPLDEKDHISIMYQAFGIPTTYIIDSKGVITEVVYGPMDEETMVNLTKNID